MKKLAKMFIVTEKAQRPARMDGRCFYCLQPVGDTHLADCMLINKKVTVKLTIEYEVEVPAHWDKHNVEFHRNDSSWCANNLMGELEELSKKNGCLCWSGVKFTCLGNDSEPYLDE